MMRFGIRRLLQGTLRCRPSSTQSAVTVVDKADGSVNVDGIELDDETVSHFIDTIGSATDRDMEVFRELVQQHLQPDPMKKKKPFNSQTVEKFKSSLESYVANVVEETTESMVEELLTLHDQHRKEYARSANPDFATFPAKDILEDSIDDPEMAAEVERRFQQRLSARSSKTINSI